MSKEITKYIMISRKNGDKNLGSSEKMLEKDIRSDIRYVRSEMKEPEESRNLKNFAFEDTKEKLERL